MGKAGKKQGFTQEINPWYSYMQPISMLPLTFSR
jgi:hypothetical protein